MYNIITNNLYIEIVASVTVRIITNSNNIDDINFMKIIQKKIKARLYIYTRKSQQITYVLLFYENKLYFVAT